MSNLDERVAELRATVHAFVGTMVDRADITAPYPAWHAWALREAFMAGVNHADEYWQARGERIRELEAAIETAVDGYLTGRFASHGEDTAPMIEVLKATLKAQGTEQWR